MNWTKPTATALLMTAVVSASLYSGAPASAASTTAPAAKSNAASTSASSSKSTTSSTASVPSGAKTSNSSTKSTTTSTKSTKNDQTNSAKADKNSSSKASSAAKAGTKDSSKAAASSKSNNNIQSAAGATTATGSTYAAWTGVSKLNHETVIPLIVEAQKRYTYTTSGGASSTAAGTFTLSGQTYRYLSQDIGTRSKLLAYLMETYTKQASETFIQKNFVQNNGKMAQLQADGGSLLEFDRATAKMISMTDTSRVYRLTVPYVDNAQPVERVMVKFALVDRQWKINTAPHVLF